MQARQSIVEINSYEALLDFLKSKKGLQMPHIYKPSMLLTVLRNGGSADRCTIAQDFLLRDEGQIDFYARKTVHPMPGRRLVRDGLLVKEGGTYSLNGVLENLSLGQREEVEAILEERIRDYLEMRNPFGDSNLDAVPGSRRYQVLKRAGGRCEACGVSSKVTQIDVGHIVPRSKRGSNDMSNLQALCRTCNAQKRASDDTNFIKVHASYEDRDAGCVFCSDPEPVQSNELAYVREDKFPVSKGHMLVIPKRHVADYFDLHMAERNAIEQLLHSAKEHLLKSDPAIRGFNIDINIGEAAGQSVFHVHVHLIPRRHGDTENPKGGIRNTIPGKGDY